MAWAIISQHNHDVTLVENPGGMLVWRVGEDKFMRFFPQAWGEMVDRELSEKMGQEIVRNWPEEGFMECYDYSDDMRKINGNDSREMLTAINLQPVGLATVVDY